MNAFHIKIIAIIAMLVDHFALFFFPDSMPLRIIGRLSFPLIAWLIANGAIHTKNIDAYALRLLLFAVIAQIPYEIGFMVGGRHPLFLNVLFTLALGLIAIRHIRATNNRTLQVAGVIALMTIASLIHVDYGALGVLTIVSFYVFYSMPALSLAAQAFIYIVLANLASWQPMLGQVFYMHPIQEYAVLALPLLLLYNGKRGRSTGLFFYWFFVAQAFAYLFLSILIIR